MVLILMGVAGTGKTTLGHMLSKETGWEFLDGDDFHSAANKAKMAGGTPLTDEDRAPWLETLHEKIEEYAGAGKNMILACSALKAQYRAILRGDRPGPSVQFVLLEAPEARLAQHLRARGQHEFMNPNLLGSQLATLEHPHDAWVISVDGTPEESLAQLLAKMREVGVLPPA